MTLKRMDSVSIVVESLDTAISLPIITVDVQSVEPKDTAPELVEMLALLL